MTKKKLLLFDLDGTITDSAPGITKSAAYALEKYGIQVSDLASLNCFVGPPLEYSFSVHCGFSKEKAAEATGYFREYYRSRGWNDCRLYPDTEDTLKLLRSRGYRIGMASSKHEPMCRQVLSHFGILELFDAVYGAEANGSRRDKPAVLRYAMELEKDILPEEMILIGDTAFDAEGAAETGIDCLGVSYGFGDLKAMEKAGVVGFAGSMKEIGELFP